MHDRYLEERGQEGEGVKRRPSANLTEEKKKDKRHVQDGAGEEQNRQVACSKERNCKREEMERKCEREEETKCKMERKEG